MAETILGQGAWMNNYGFNDGEGISATQNAGSIGQSVNWEQSVRIVKTTSGRVGFLTVDSAHGVGSATFVEETDPKRIQALQVLLSNPRPQ